MAAARCEVFYNNSKPLIGYLDRAANQLIANVTFSPRRPWDWSKKEKLIDSRCVG